MMILPYTSEKGCNLIKSLKRNLRRALPVNIQTHIVYTGTNRHDIVCYSFCSAEHCNGNYICESARRLDERIKDHNS